MLYIVLNLKYDNKLILHSRHEWSVKKPNKTKQEYKIKVT